MGDPTEAGIPVIDFSAYRLSLTKPDTTQFQKLVDDVHKALTTIGFFFMVNTDFPHEKVDELYQVSRKFFDLPSEAKQNPPIAANGSHGYAHLERERINRDLPYGDLKESFNYSSATEDNEWPMESACPGFKTTNENFFELCVPLHDRVLEVMAHGLNLEDPLFFVKRHAKPNRSCLRPLFYPSLDDVTVKDQQVRCSEHSDLGGITMLFQQVPGLEVCKRGGGYDKVPLVEGGILVNIGDLMQRWTSDTYLATRHRVLLDGTPEERSQSRQSIAFFGNPSEEAVIECTDNSNKYPPVTCREYLDQTFNTAYK
ncbi:2-oxoglutarate-dependent dioxygenase htyE-like isoform X1 [Asterias rubens]|uniref:2-oxoglutarate-dependent dioxygenase htyE-like isoform X1 n=1 Tax=Asterias rubens TaxID=7604 RepID=UPI00145589D5|nr:2-oxoglutarate-dependent dioxygenase htyE-like isoform X1 [Asterias rubens]